MLSLPANYRTKNNAINKQPVYVAKIFWNNGNTGVDNTNDIYFATCDMNDITGFPYPARWFPFLKADSIGSMSQKVDPVNGVSSIGSLDITITDYNNMVSNIIKAADEAGHGLRRQRIAIYALHKGNDWVSDKVCMRTMQVQELRLTQLNEYTITASDVQRQMQKTIFNPYSTTLSGAIATTGAITPAVADSRKFTAVASVKYGTVGFIKIDDEILRWTAKTETPSSGTYTFTIGAVDRGLFGSVAAVHSDGATVSEVIVLNENPIIMALKILESSGVPGTNGTYDAYPARWGCNMDSTNDIDEAGILEVGKLLTGLSNTPAAANGTQFEFVINKGVEAKQFIEDSIWKILGSFGFVRGDGRYGIKAYSDLANASKENASVTLDRNAVVRWGELAYNYSDLTNQVWIEYDEYPKLSDKFIRTAIFVDSVSIKKWGEAKQLKYKAYGVIATSDFASRLYQVFQRVLSRYSRPPMQIPLTLLPRYHDIEIGDISRVNLPIRDVFTGASLDRAFEIISTQLVPKTGEVEVVCIAQPEKGAQWFQGVGSIDSVVVSPAVANIPTGTTLQMVVRAFDGSGIQVTIPSILWQADGAVTVNSSGLVTAGAVGTGHVFALVGTTLSNVCTITITASANTNPVASVVVLPSSIQLKAGDTQQLSALAYDINGSLVNGKTFNWSSSNTGVATVPAGAAAAKLLTAVANGSSNITATETVSGTVSSPAAVIVAVPDTPTYAPPALLDSAYHIGTQITAHGPVGGPHVIPNGYNFPSGDYWYDGNVSLASGTSCTINGTVRICSVGTMTINGTIDGVGRGSAGSTDFVQGFLGSSGSSAGVSRAPIAGYANPAYVYPWAPFPLYSSAPLISPVFTYSGGSVSQITGGLPIILLGGNGPKVVIEMVYDGTVGPYGSLTNVAHDMAYRPSGGAGLLMMARGFYLTTGNINLSGENGSVRTVSGFTWPLAGGGGGSLVVLIQANSNGLPTHLIDKSRINVSGGAESTNGTPEPTAGAGTAGCIITQVIG
jgi:hypothetical protein